MLLSLFKEILIILEGQQIKRLLLESTPYEGLENGTHIDVTVYYDIGGVDFLEGETKLRGYYVSVTPVIRRDNMVSKRVFTGYKSFLLQTSRFSTKQFEQAVELARPVVPVMIKRVLKEERAA